MSSETNAVNATRTILDMSILQAVAESYLDQWTGLGGKKNPNLNQIVNAGNNNLTKLDPALDRSQWSGATGLTESQFKYFTDHFEIVTHYPNDASGFSATVFRNTETEEIIISFRSTEYQVSYKGGDWEADGADGADGDILDHGFALAQLSSMETFYAKLRQGFRYTKGAWVQDPIDGLTANPPGSVTVTGYSLGGHLATAFTLLHPEANTFTFNSPGTGGIDGQAPTMATSTAPSNLSGLITLYDQLMAWDGARESLEQIHSDLMPELLMLYDEMRDPDNQDSPMLDIVLSSSDFTPYHWKHDAVMSLLDQVTSGTLAMGVEQAIDANARFINGGFDPGQLVSAVGEVAGWDQRITQVYGHGLFYDPQFVSNSGYHASPRYEFGVPIEDLPMSRAAGFLELGGIWIRDKVGDFGETHSITLLTDALTVVELLQRVAPGFDMTVFSSLLASVSNRIEEVAPPLNDPSATIQETMFSAVAQNQLYDSDALEILVNEIGRIFLGDAFTPIGGKFDDPEGFQDRDSRDAMHALLDRIAESPAFASASDLQILPLAGMSAGQIETLARKNIGVRFALEEGLHFAIAGASAESIYATHNAAGVFDNAVFSDEYLSDRANYLEWKLRYQSGGEDAHDRLWRALSFNPLSMDWGLQPREFADALGDKQFTDDWDTYDLAGDWDFSAMSDASWDENADGRLDDIGFTIDGTPEKWFELVDNHRIAFGDERGNQIDGAGNADRLYGRAGDDKLSGFGEDDFLEGGGGNDELVGGEGSDILVGGQGNDVYRIGEGSDEIDDSDGAGSVVWQDGTTVVGRSAVTDLANWVGLSDTRFWDRQNGFFYELLPREDGGYRLSISSPSRGDGTSRVLIDNFKDGDLGIALGETSPPPAAMSITDGNDRVGFINESDPMLQQARSVDGRAGNDLVSGGHADDYLDGGAGDDFLVGGAGSDTLLGGGGADFILDDGAPVRQEEPDPEDIPDRPEGSIPYSSGAGWWVNARQEGDTTVYYHYYDPAVSGAVGLAFNDFATGGEGNDVIFMSRGNDTASGDAGNDAIVGGYDHDYLDGGDGNDSLYGDLSGGNPAVLPGFVVAGKDTLVGGAGDDLLVGNGGGDLLSGGSEDDEIFGDNQDGQILGAAAPEDYVTGDDVIDAGAGNDLVHGGGGDDRIDGGSGNDTLFGDNATSVSSLDQYREFDGKDEIEGGDGDDIAYGMGGDDILRGGSGNDTLVGDHGGIAAHYHGNDLLVGGDGDDKLSGCGGQDQLEGGAGNDVLEGGQGADLLVGGTGSDHFKGGEGDDTYEIDLTDGDDVIWELDASSAGNDVIRLSAEISATTALVDFDSAGNLLITAPGSDRTLTLVGFFNNTDAGHRIEFRDGTVWTVDALAQRFRPADGTFNGDGNGNTIVGGSSADTIDGRLGNDILVGGSGDDHVLGGANNGTQFVGTDNDALFGGAGNDMLESGEGDDLLDGGDGDDLLDGGYGADTLYGRAGNDDLDAKYWEYINGYLYQDLSNDLLVGGAGDDHLEGGMGTNIYRFEAGDGSDRITLTKLTSEYSNALRSEQAVLQFGSSVTAADISFVPNGVDLVIRYGDAQIVVENYGDRADVSVDFVFDDDSVLSAEQTALLSRWPGSPRAESLSGGAGNDTLQGFEGDDALYGNDGNDILDGGQGRDRLAGGSGDDTYRYGLSDGVDRIETSAGSDVLEFGPGIRREDLSIYKGPVNSGQASLYFVVNATGNFVETTWYEGQEDQAVDLLRFADGSVMTSAEANAASSAMDFPLEVYGATGSMSVAGNDLANKIWPASNSYATLFGGKGDDVYFINDYANREGTVIEKADEGNDTVVTDYYGYTMGDNVENLVVTSTNLLNWYARAFTGNALDNIIDGSAAANPAGTRLDGGAGADVLIGSNGNDTFVIDTAGDRIIESLTSKSVDTVETTFSYSIADSNVIENITLVGAADATATGNAGANRLDGNTSMGANVLSGGAGNDSYLLGFGDTVVEEAGGGIDTVEFLAYDESRPTIVLEQNIENGILTSTWFQDMDGNAADNLLRGNNEANTLRGLAGMDLLQGGYGDDRLFGDDGNDTLEGGAGQDQLDGGTGDDAMRGGDGNDEYFVDAAGDSIEESASQGFDRVYSTALDFALGDNLENLVLRDGAISGSGNASDNRIEGNALDNVLAGGMGNDELIGGSGADTYIYALGDGDDAIMESGNLPGEEDVLQLGDGVEVGDLLVHRSGAGIALQIGEATIHWGAATATGSSLIERIRLADGTSLAVDDLINDPPQVANWLDWQPVMEGDAFSLSLPANLFANDPGEPLSLSIGELPAWLQYDPETQTFSGTPHAADNGDYSVSITATDTAGQSVETWLDTSVLHPVVGTAGADSLAGTLGEDAMRGGLGDDIYTVNHASDMVIENPGEGIDTVLAEVNYQLGENVERLMLTGAADRGCGNALDNVLTGNSVDNELYGEDGDDTLDGGSGADYMEGGNGNDVFIVDDAGDVVDEGGSGKYAAAIGDGGVDTVRSSVTYTLTDGVEHLVLTGTGTIDGTGSASDNTLTGNSAANRLSGGEGNDVLDGGAGSDTLIGGGGDDTFIVGSGDVVTEVSRGGTDTVVAAVNYTLGNYLENLTLTGVSALTGNGNGLANVIIGNAGKNSLSGLGGDDVLNGGADADTLTGGTGGDRYMMARGNGADTIVESDTTAGTTDVAQFLAGVSFDQLWFRRPSGTSNLEISIIGTSDKLTVKNWYLGSRYQVEEVRTMDDDRVLKAADVQTLVNAMAGLTPPSAGQTTLPSDYRTRLAAAFASAWHDGGAESAAALLPVDAAGFSGLDDRLLAHDRDLSQWRTGDWRLPGNGPFGPDRSETDCFPFPNDPFPGFRDEVWEVEGPPLGGGSARGCHTQRPLPPAPGTVVAVTCDTRQPQRPSPGVAPMLADCDTRRPMPAASLASGSGCDGRRLLDGTLGTIAPVISDCHQLIQSMAQFGGRSGNAEFQPGWENWQHGQQHVMLR